MFVGLVHDPGQGRGDDDLPPPPDRRVPYIPWRPFAWFAVFCWLMVLAAAVDGLGGYLIVLGALALGCWRLDRWMGGLYMQGLREVQR